MDNSELFVAAGGAALIGFILWFFFDPAAEEAPAGAGRYACPMHPWITSDDPAAACSECGMSLIRREDA